MDDRLLEGDAAALGERAAKLLTARLVGISVVVPEASLARLREVPIQLDLTHGALRPMQYHPSRTTLCSVHCGAWGQKYCYTAGAVANSSRRSDVTLEREPRMEVAIWG